MKSLDEISILDCTTLLPGPYATMILRELGANVLKIEKPGFGETLRKANPGLYNYLNSRKKLITLDLKHSKGHGLFLKLAEDADVIVEGFRPGVTKRLGIDFNMAKKANPSIIYCSISGYGQTGPYAHLPGHDINYMGLVGQLSLCGDPESGRPEYPGGLQVADMSGSMFAVISILAALMRQKESSSALFLDIAMAETCAMWVVPRFFEYIDQNRPQKSIFMGRGPYGVFETRDGKYISLGVFEDHFWDNLCNAIGFDDLETDESLKGWANRNRQRHKIVPRLEKVFREKDLDYWLNRLGKANVPVAPVRDFENWLMDPQVRHWSFGTMHREGGGEDGEKIDLKRYPVNSLVKGQNKTPREPILGRDTYEILLKLGLSQNEILKLKKEKVI